MDQICGEALCRSKTFAVCIFLICSQQTLCASGKAQVPDLYTQSCQRYSYCMRKAKDVREVCQTADKESGTQNPDQTGLTCGDTLESLRLEMNGLLQKRRAILLDCYETGMLNEQRLRWKGFSVGRSLKQRCHRALDDDLDAESKLDYQEMPFPKEQQSNGGRNKSAKVKKNTTSSSNKQNFDSDDPKSTCNAALKRVKYKCSIYRRCCPLVDVCKQHLAENEIQTEIESLREETRLQRQQCRIQHRQLKNEEMLEALVEGGI